MTPALLAGLVPVLLGLVAAQPGTVQTVTRLVVQDEVVLRVPVQPRPRMSRITWVEQQGVKCIRTGKIRRALLSDDGEVDFVMASRLRVRAKFSRNCPALDFWGGFYLQPEDDRICARRDAVHSRIGGSCTIAAFQLLRPQIKD